MLHIMGNIFHIQPKILLLYKYLYMNLKDYC